MTNPEVNLIVIMTALPDHDQADQIAKILVTEKLAACVQVMPQMISTYRWQGEICRDTEHLVLIKALQTNYEAIASRLRSLHPYETPEILALSAIAVEQNYLQWAVSN